MQSKLSDLIDNLSGINNKERKSCMERTKYKSECYFIGFKIIDQISNAKSVKKML